MFPFDSRLTPSEAEGENLGEETLRKEGEGKGEQIPW